MDIIEVGVMGVRAAVVELRAKGSRCRFTLFPMVHVADPSFYAQVAARLGRHDLVVAEGVVGSRVIRRMRARYQRVARRLGLRMQPLGLCEVGVPVINPDIVGTDFDRRWRRISLSERLYFGTVRTLVWSYLSWFGSRELLAAYLELDDDILNVEEPSPFEHIEELSGGHRDKLLCQALTGIHHSHRDDPIDVAVVYGAGHVRPVVSYLHARHGYVVASADWMTIFTW